MIYDPITMKYDYFVLIQLSELQGKLSISTDDIVNASRRFAPLIILNDAMERIKTCLVEWCAINCAHRALILGYAGDEDIIGIFDDKADAAAFKMMFG